MQLKLCMTLFLAIFSSTLWASSGEFCSGSNQKILWQCDNGNPGAGWLAQASNCYHFDTGSLCTSVVVTTPVPAVTDSNSSCTSGSFCNINTIDWKCGCGDQGVNWLDQGGGCYHLDTQKSCTPPKTTSAVSIISSSGRVFDPEIGCGESPISACMIYGIAACPSDHPACHCQKQYAADLPAWRECSYKESSLKCNNSFSHKVKSLSGWQGAWHEMNAGCVGHILLANGNVNRVAPGYDPDAPVVVRDPCAPDASGTVAGPCPADSNNNPITFTAIVDDINATTNFRCFQKKQGQSHACADKQDSSCMDHPDSANLISDKQTTLNFENKCLDEVKAALIKKGSSERTLENFIDSIKNSDQLISFQDGATPEPASAILARLRAGKASLCELRILKEANIIADFKLNDLLYPNIAGVKVSTDYSVSTSWTRPALFDYDLVYINKIYNSCNYSLVDKASQRVPSNAKTCEFNLQNDYFNYLIRNNQMKAELSSISFEFSVLNDPALNSSSGDQAKLKTIAIQNQTRRKEFNDELVRNTKELNCLCLSTQPEQYFIENSNKKTEFIANCPIEYAEYSEFPGTDSSGNRQKKYISLLSKSTLDMFSSAVSRSADFLVNAGKLSLSSTPSSNSSVAIQNMNDYSVRAKSYLITQGVVGATDTTILNRFTEVVRNDHSILESYANRSQATINSPPIDLNLFVSQVSNVVGLQMQGLNKVVSSSQILYQKELGSYLGSLELFNSQAGNMAIRRGALDEEKSVKMKLDGIVQENKLIKSSLTTELVKEYAKANKVSPQRIKYLNSLANIRALRAVQIASKSKSLTTITSPTRRKRIQEVSDKLFNNNVGGSTLAYEPKISAPSKVMSYQNTDREKIMNQEKVSAKKTSTGDSDRNTLGEAINVLRKVNSTTYSSNKLNTSLFEKITNAYIRNYDKVHNDKDENNN